MKAAALGAHHLLGVPTVLDGVPEPRHRARGGHRARRQAAARRPRRRRRDRPHPGRSRGGAVRLRPARLPRDRSPRARRSRACGRLRHALPARDLFDAADAGDDRGDRACATGSSPASPRAVRLLALTTDVDADRHRRRARRARRIAPRGHAPYPERVGRRVGVPRIARPGRSRAGHTPRIPGSSRRRCAGWSRSMAEVVVVEDQDAAGALVAGAIVSLIRSKPDAVLGLATGSTPLATYRALAARIAADRHRRARRARIRARRVRGPAGRPPRELPRGHHPRGRRAARAHPRAGARAERRSRDGIEHAGADYEAAITAAGGVDLQILGIGRTGHIGFNEPGSSLASLTRVKTLTEPTRARQRPLLRLARRRAHALHHPGHRHDPARPAPGAARVRRGQGATRSPRPSRDRCRRTSPARPSSCTRTRRSSSTRRPRRRLENLDYYRHAWANKPAWQGI